MTTSPTIDQSPSTTASEAHKVLAIVGHPNVGKSVIFHALTGKYVTVSNFPGTTVDLSKGDGSFGGETWKVIDTPGVVSLHAKTDDERVARDFLIESKPDVVLQVADSKNLSKTIHLTLELSEFGLPVVLALNMADERKNRGIEIDVVRLSSLLGIPVIDTVAVTGEGIQKVKDQLKNAKIPKIRPRYDSQLAQLIEQIEVHLDQRPSFRRALAVSLFTNDSSAWDHASSHANGNYDTLKGDVHTGKARFVRPIEMLIFEAKQQVVQEIMGEVQSTQKKTGFSWLAKLGLWSMRPFPGYLLAAFTLFALYEFVGVFGAGILVGFLEETVFGAWLNPFVIKLVQTAIPIPFIQDLLIGEYGTVTMALTYAFALILPIVSTFFLFFGFLEDSGYLPRLAVMMDRLFRLMGLNGRAVLPMVLGLGCDTMATVTTRIMDTRKEKIILSILLTLSVPCSAQLGAVLGMAGGLSWKVLTVWLGVVSGTMMLVGWGAARVLPGGRSPFLVELPPLRVPQLSNIYKKVKARLKWYTKEVIPLFVLATFVLFILDKIKLLQKMEEWISPIVVGLLGLPSRASEAFLVGFFRRDYGAAGFFQMAQEGLLSAHQVTVSMVVITLFMPCVAHVLITAKERGIKVTTVIVGFTLAFALTVGGLVNWLLNVTNFI